MARICIDAGHWGRYNQSPALPDYYESEVMWRLQELLCEELEALGVQTVRTREDISSDLPLTERGRRAEGCGLFLSLHSNAVAGNGVREDIDYPVAYVPVSGEADEVGLRLAQTVERVMGTSQSARIEHRANSSGKDYYGVLRGSARAGVPGVILEHSFHTNSRAANWLTNDSNLRALAAAEARVIAEYSGVCAPAAPASAASAVPDRYRYLTDVPESDGFRAVIAELMSKGIIRGDGKTPCSIDLSRDTVRILVILHRAGVFDNKPNNDKETDN
ncbi:MAG: N-acetylmuramoyl-L-alanine amidase [Clostridia bacterium]|nr:N-acetylmuramoyl-L-alanine amidase [Clostridia bacterium]